MFSLLSMLQILARMLPLFIVAMGVLFLTWGNTTRVIEKDSDSLLRDPELQGLWKNQIKCGLIVIGFGFSLIPIMSLIAAL